MKDTLSRMCLPHVRLVCARILTPMQSVVNMACKHASVGQLTIPYLDALESLHWLGSYKHRALPGQSKVPVLGNYDISRSARAVASTGRLC